MLRPPWLGVATPKTDLINQFWPEYRVTLSRQCCHGPSSDSYFSPFCTRPLRSLYLSFAISPSSLESSPDFSNPNRFGRGGGRREGKGRGRGEGITLGSTNIQVSCLTYYSCWTFRLGQGTFPCILYQRWAFQLPFRLGQGTFPCILYQRWAFQLPFRPGQGTFPCILYQRWAIPLPCRLGEGTFPCTG